MKVVSTTMNRKKDQSLTRSARVPDTIEAAEARNTIWKSHSDIVAWPFFTTAAAADASPSSSAFSSGVGPWNSVSEPIHPPFSTPVNMNAVPDEVEGQGGDGADADVLQADDRCILGAHGAGFQHREARAHPHHERAPDEEGEGTQDELGLAVETRPCGGRQERQTHDGRGSDPERGPAVPMKAHSSPAARARRVRRLIFPELVNGNSSTNSTIRGYLYAARLRLTWS